MRAIVLVKQVPDLRAAPVGVAPDGTIARESAAAITNPADLHALEAALQLTDDVTAVTMGPPRAEEVLRDTISRGATSGVLLADRMLAGSDTWATANALAAAIRHLGGADLVLSGLTALDGETGQVGPQVATRLGLPQATGCESLVLDGDRLVARRIVEGGYERLRLPLPALVTIAETGYAPRYPTMPGRRRAAHAEIVRLVAADIGVDAEQVGLEASPTKVARMTPAPLPDRGCRLVGDDASLADLDGLARELVALGALDASDVATSSPPKGDSALGTPSIATVDPATDDPAIWVVCELDDGRLTSGSTELLTKAVELAPALGGGVGAFCAAREPRPVGEEASSYGAGAVFLAADPELSPYRSQPHARVLADALRAHAPAAVLFGASTTGRDLAPRVAAMLDVGLAADCTDLEVAPWERRRVRYDALLHQIRPAMAGGVLATCVAPEARPQMATVRPGTFAPLIRPVRSHIVDVPVHFEAEDFVVEVLDREVRYSDVRLTDAEVIVAGGAGCDATSWHLVEDLAAVIGGKVAATRGAVEAGLAPRSLQVGQTGTTVHPRLYVACGISGALQHVVGMRSARTVLAVNRDPDALIFHVANFGVVGEVADVLPALTEAVGRAVRSIR